MIMSRSIAANVAAIAWSVPALCAMASVVCNGSVTLPWWVAWCDCSPESSMTKFSVLWFYSRMHAAKHVGLASVWVFRKQWPPLCNSCPWQIMWQQQRPHRVLLPQRISCVSPRSCARAWSNCRPHRHRRPTKWRVSEAFAVGVIQYSVPFQKVLAPPKLQAHAQASASSAICHQPHATCHMPHNMSQQNKQT